MEDVWYISSSGNKYRAIITGVPNNPKHEGTDLLTLSLEFRDVRGKLVRKERVLPECVSNIKEQVWRPL